MMHIVESATILTLTLLVIQVTGNVAETDIEYFTSGRGTISDQRNTSTWTFMPTNSIVLISFLNFNFELCDESKIVLKSPNGDEDFSCDNVPDSVMQLKGRFTVEFQRPNGDCNCNFVFEYLFPHFVVEPLTVTASTNVDIWFSFPKLFSHCQADCDINISGNKKILVLDGEKESSLTYKFQTSGKFNIDANCLFSIKADKKPLAKEHSVFYKNADVQDSLSSALFTSELPRSFNMTKPISEREWIIIKHSFAYSIKYCLALRSRRSVSICHEASYSNEDIDNRLEMSVKFSISSDYKNLLGPGLHEMVLLLENVVSTVSMKSLISISEELRNLKIQTPKYVGLYPATFPVIVKIEGSPAFIEVNVIEHSEGKTVETFTGQCNNNEDCREAVVQASVVSSGIYNVSVTATNILGAVNSSWETFESFYLVYDAFVATSSSAYKNEDIAVYVFYNIKGEDMVRVTLKYDAWPLPAINITQHETWQNATEKVKDLILPFDPKEFKIFFTTLNFKYAVQYDISVKVSTKNGKEWKTSKWSLQLLNRDTKSCLTGVKIRDGNEGYIINVTLRGQSTILLSAKPELNCEIEEVETISYQWTISKVETLSKTTSAEDFDSRGIVSNQAELVIRNTFPPGLYVIKVKCKIVNYYHVPVSSASDYTSIRIEKPKIDLQICGGNLTEIGTYVTEISLSAKCSMIPRTVSPTFRWFCALSKEDLPSDRYEGTYKTKGSCYWRKPSFVGQGVEEKILLKNITADFIFYIRVFASAANYEDSFADQMLTLRLLPTPSVGIKCWKNCAKQLNLQENLLLELECTSCNFYSWQVTLGSRDISTCKNTRFCLVPSTFLVVIPKSDNPTETNTAVRVRGTGYDTHGTYASVVFRASVAAGLDIPSCNVSPNTGFTFVTKFNISCPAGDGLLYKFFALNQDGKLLLQYGYENTLEDFAVAEKRTVIQVEICSSFGICSDKSVAIYAFVRNLTDLTNSDLLTVENRIIQAARSEDLHTALTITALLPKDIKLHNEWKYNAANMVMNLNIDSGELAKQMADILVQSTRNPVTAQFHCLEMVFDKIKSINEWIKQDEESSSKLLNLIAESSLFVLSNVLESLCPPDKIEPEPLLRSVNRIVNELGSKMLEATLPGNDVTEYKFPKFKTYFQKFTRSKGIAVADIDTELRLKPERCFGPHCVFNLQVVRFNVLDPSFNNEIIETGDVIGVEYSRSYKENGKSKIDNRPFVPTHPIKFYLHKNRPGIGNTTKLRFRIPFHGAKSQNLSIEIKKNVKSTFVNIRMLSGDIPCNVKLNLTLRQRLDDDDASWAFEETKRINGTDFKQKEYNWRVLMAEGEGVYDLIVDAEVELTPTDKYNATTVVFDLDVASFATVCRWMWDGEWSAWTQRGCKAIQGRKHESDWCECDLKHWAYSRTLKSQHIMSSILSVFTQVRPYKLNLDFVEIANGTVDFEKTWDNIRKNIAKNPTVIILLFIVVTGCLTIMTWAYFEDVKQENQPQHVEVGDNMPNENYRYLITVFTSCLMGASPTSTVAVKIYGRSGSSPVHVLQKYGGVKRLSRGSCVTFLVTTPETLDDVKALEIWHDRRGLNPQWFIDRITIRDQERGECWFFPVRRLLKSQTSRSPMVLFPANTTEVHSFRNFHLLKFVNNLRKSHIFFSAIWSWPSDCISMSRTEKAGCMLQNVLMLMATSLSYHNLEADESELLDRLSLYNIIAGAKTGIWCFFMTVQLSLMFSLAEKRKKPINTRNGSGKSHAARQANTTARDVVHHEIDEQPRRSSRRRVETRSLSTPKTRLGRSSRRTRSVLRHQDLSPRGTDSDEPGTSGLNGPLVRERRPRQPRPAARAVLMTRPKRGPSIAECDPASQYGQLPWILRPVTWIVLSYMSMSSVTFCIWHGINFGKVVTEKWLITFFFSILESMTLLEAAKAFGTTFISILNKPRLDVADWMPPITRKIAPRPVTSAVAMGILRERVTSPLYRPHIPSGAYRRPPSPDRAASVQQGQDDSREKPQRKTIKSRETRAKIPATKALKITKPPPPKRTHSSSKNPRKRRNGKTKSSAAKKTLSSHKARNRQHERPDRRRVRVAGQRRVVVNRKNAPNSTRRH